MTNADQYERYMLTLINADREERGLDPLQLERNLNQAAEDHSEWMLAADKFSHTGQGGSSATARMRDADFDFSGGWRSAENIAIQSERGASGIKDDVADLHQSLMNSPGHYRNLMNPDLDYIGIGVEVGNFNFGSGAYESVIVTQNFASTGGKVDLDTSSTGTSGAPQPTGGRDILVGTSGDDRLQGQAGDDLIKAAKGDDVVYGGTGSDHLRGGRDNDRLFGNDGNDKLSGGRGADVLDGGRGSDVMFGRDGADRFVFSKGNMTDRIADFENNRDTIDLRDLDFANTAHAMKHASQRGDDVVFDFKGADKLIVADATLGQINDDLLI